MEKEQVKKSIPLTIETGLGEFRLEKIDTTGLDLARFSVVFKFYNPLDISHETIFALENLEEFVKRNCFVMIKEVANFIK